MSKFNLAEVRIALDVIADREARMEIVRTVGGVSALSKVPEEKFEAIIKAANARALRGNVRPGANASRDVNEEAAQYWDDRKAAKPGEAVPVPNDPGGHNAQELQKLGTERADFEKLSRNA